MSSEEEDGAALMAAFQKKRPSAAPNPPQPVAPAQRNTSLSPGDFFSDDDSSAAPAPRAASRPASSRSSTRVAVAVQVRPPRNLDDYVYYEPREEVRRIIREYNRKGQLMYEVELEAGQRKQISFDNLQASKGGQEALRNFHHDTSPSDNEMPSSSDEETRPGLRRRPRKNVEEGFIDSGLIDTSEDELVSDRKKLRQSLSARQKNGRTASHTSRRRNAPLSVTSDDSEDSGRQPRRRRRKVTQEPTRRSGRVRMPAYSDQVEDEDEDDSSDSGSLNILRSDVLSGGRKRKRGALGRTGVRQSDRATRAQHNMKEIDQNDIYRSDSIPKEPGPKIVSVREVFQPLERSNLFRSRHVEFCEAQNCGRGTDMAPLVYCQGCSLAYHKDCLGNRANRDHLVTKVGPDNFVLQCKRCINFYKRKDPTAPDLARCVDCRRPGPACRPFRQKKTTLQEQKDRDDNGGQDPIVEVPAELINNAGNVLFRCTSCFRAYHYHHLPPLSPYATGIERDEDEAADERFLEYSQHWNCKECKDTSGRKVSGLIAWRPSDFEAYAPHTPCETLSEDEKQYLIKWENQSYFRAEWHSGSWTWGRTAPVMRKAFFKREQGPKMRTEDAIPEDFLRIDIVLDVKYTNHVVVRSEEIDKARIKEVDTALIKYKGLGYEDAVWEKVPTPEDGDRWLDFVTAYNDWVAGRYIRCPKPGPLQSRIDKARATDFRELEKEKQPDNLVGGELMKYQIDGLNWIYYQWHSKKNGILADEMGLGKTIQVIGFMATLIQEHNCFPFLVVVPNSTCANWRREIKQWAPSLRVVTFFGSAAARDMAYKYEMCPQGNKELRCHIVVTSYEAASDDSCRKVLGQGKWAGLIVDEGQRLKNDKSQLYTALSAFKAPFRLLLTGTPLQNNARELFNLLQFLDDKINAAELEEKYAEVTLENIRELHEEIRPFILRRTKKQVLTFLPPLGQIIVPLSMSVLQKNLYKSILAKNPELLKALFMTHKTLKPQERASLSNILMQLRKCLCHPFVYSREIEERTDIAAVSHRNLVEASAKLQFLELMLPKIKERGHRVLIFSQFLDMLNIVEDFLEGMSMDYQRLDGTMGSLEKQKRIDQFNAPDSPLFAFLLSTRAGGVGINLATADTVIILDPDFNPHQDIQAISRAHRIGQNKKVLCFQLMTRASVEEKIVQMGRKKMALDHVVVEQLDADDLEEKDVESMLKHGAAELFQDDAGDQDIRYDETSINRLLDRSQIENTATDETDTVESQFSFARVWANDQGALQDQLETAEEEVAPDPGVWDGILKKRQAEAAAEQLARAEALGRGKRARQMVTYHNERESAVDAGDAGDAGDNPSPAKPDKKPKRKQGGDDSDTDFQAHSEEEKASSSSEGEGAEPENLTELARPNSEKAKPSLYMQNGAGPSSPRHTPRGFLQAPAARISVPSHKEAPLEQHRAPNSTHASMKTFLSQHRHTSSTASNGKAVKPFTRVHIPVPSPLDSYSHHESQTCAACRQQHPRGACPLKVAGVEHCNLCGLAHYGVSRTCPHIRSETQVREMIEALKNSPEKREHVELALKYLRGVKGHLVQAKKKERERAMLQGQFRPGGQYASPYIQSSGQPQRDVSRAFETSRGASSTSHGSGQSGHAPQPVQHNQPAQRQQRDEYDETAVASALRGFLGS
ncbi:hypothetical protein M011DRAFT_420044 [Sporormia fimetaria CBS 119925]|uniref:Chromatin remodeling complex subunit n=1 Tax=Sporormia fimetaria CBS 119925 TaxID=1340428 RepID=A0A6A6VG55_9PLEO|nr:hypothetical protein M011DRAFT_420044 [Sporormia fimetaria CBS 119925]